MDDEDYLKFLLFVVTVGGGILMVAGIKACRGQSYWATHCILTGGLGLFLLFGFVFLSALAESASHLGDDELILFGCSLLLALLAFMIGTFSFCARFGATCRRSTQLEEIASALAAAESADLAQKNQSE